MEHNSSYHKQLRKKTVKGVMKKSYIADVDKKKEKLDDIPGEINLIKKAIRRRRQKDREN